MREKFLGGMGGRGVTVVGVIGVSLTGSSVSTSGTPSGMEKHSTGEGRLPPRSPSSPRRSFVSLKDVANAIDAAALGILETCCADRNLGRDGLAGRVARNRLSAESLLWK